MLGWLARKGPDARVSTCVRKLKGELETSAPVRRATILASAQFFRAHLLAQLTVPVDFFDRPFDYSRAELMPTYEVLESLQSHNALQIEATKQAMHFSEMELPQLVTDHAETMDRGLETWMCTLGAGISPACREDVRLIWASLAASFEHMAEAIRHLRNTEEQITILTGKNSDQMFSAIDTRDWIDFCRFVPSSFVKELEPV